MIRKKAIQIVLENIGNHPIVSANGFISRDVWETKDKESNFYMIGSMGLASSIALGIALEKKKKKVIIFDGDGNILMNLGSLATIGSFQPKNLIHFVFDNSIHESTGGQPTISSSISLEKVAKSTNYKTFKINSELELKTIIPKLKNLRGPIFILVKVQPSSVTSERVKLSPLKIKNRFMESLK